MNALITQKTFTLPFIDRRQNECFNSAQTESNRQKMVLQTISAPYRTHIESPQRDLNPHLRRERATTCLLVDGAWGD